MRALIACLICLPWLSGCSNLQSEDGIIAKSTQLLSRTGELLGQQTQSLDTSPDQAQYDRELSELFAQPYIAPLSSYLNAHAGDDTRAAHLRQVDEERQRRCQRIGERYATRDKTPANLERLRSSYGDSCPAEIARFAALVPPAANSSPQPTTPASPTAKVAAQPIDSALANNCYLLFSIKNYSQARAACLEPAEAGDGKAQYNLSVIASSLEQYPDALHWARRAASQSAEGRYQLGQLYLHGQGVAQNPATAFAWFEQAAEQGLARAQYQCALMQQDGQGTERNPAQAHKRFEQAARQGHRDAQLALAQLYLRGEGTRADADKAHQWLLRAARQNSAAAQYQLGELHAEGHGVSRDAAAAYVWLRLAQQNGAPQAAERLAQLRTQIDEQQIAQAQLQVRQALELPH